MRGAHHARRTVDRAAEKVFIAALGDTRVQPAAYPEHDTVSRSRVGERQLQLECGVDGVDGVLDRRVLPSMSVKRKVVTADSACTPVPLSMLARRA
jgi:hypothetical protein